VGRGEQLSVARPPGRVPGAPQARKVKNNRVEWYPVNIPQKHKKWYTNQFQKFTPKKLSQAADEIFRVAAWTRSEVAVSLRLWVGQVDAEKLAQRSSVAA